MPAPLRFRGVTAVLLFGALAGLACGRRSDERPAAAARPTAAPAMAAAVETVDAANRDHRAAGVRPGVIWLGLDGLDWDLLDRLVAENRMPNWKRLTAAGYTARLKSFMPVLSPVVWTTIATGVGPDVHRVLDFQEVDPATGQKVPISGRSRAVPAVWNVATAAGRSVGVVGWWATHPAEEVSGFFVSDHASPIMFEGLPRAGVVYPSAFSPGVEQIVARDAVVADADIRRFVEMSESELQRARSSGGGLENPLVALSRIVGSTRVQHHIARDLYDKTRPDLMVLYLEGTDAIGHVFAPYVPPKMSCVSEAEFGRYRRVVDDYYALIDQVLGQWMRRADEDGATLVVNSDHGFKWGVERPCERSSLNPATAAFWHRMDGVLAFYGARVKASAERGSASVFDLAPTVSALAGLAIDKRMSGNALRAAFTDLAAPARQDLFGTVPVRRVAAQNASEKEASEYAKSLRALGYLSGGEPEKLTASGGQSPGVTEGGWNNLGVFLRENTKNLGGAEAAFEKALALRPTYASPQFNLAVLYRQRGDDRKAIDWLFRSLEAGHADPEGTLLTWSAEYRDGGKRAQAGSVLERGHRQYPASESLARDLALHRFQSKDCPGAWDAVGGFESSTRTPQTINALALFKTCLGKRDDAVSLFQKSLAIQPDQPGVIQSIHVLQKGPSEAN